jgi:DNA-binding transcriptional regulator YiaG
MARNKAKRVRRKKFPRAASRRIAGKGSLIFVATNDQFETDCKESVKSLPPSVRALVQVAGITSQPEKSWHGGTTAVVVLSRLEDLSGDVLDRLKESHVTKQVVFIRGLPVEAVAARLMALRLHSPSRLHITAKASCELEAKMIQRLVTGMAEGDEEHPIIDAWIEQDSLVLLSVSFHRMTVPQSKLCRFLGEGREDFNNFEIDEDGRFIYWPHADAHFGWKQLEQLIDPTKAIKDQQKSSQFNLKYGQAIRVLRENSGLKQSEINGLTERQLRRIEHGQQMATTNALKLLASSHNLAIGDYMSQLASLVSAN